MAWPLDEWARSAHARRDDLIVAQPGREEDMGNLILSLATNQVCPFPNLERAQPITSQYINGCASALSVSIALTPRTVRRSRSMEGGFSSTRDLYYGGTKMNATARRRLATIITEARWSRKVASK